MVAFSCCEYDGGEEEKHEMDIARERSWRGKFRRRHRIIRPGANRVDGKCPLTPLEVSGYKFSSFFIYFYFYFLVGFFILISAPFFLHHWCYTLFFETNGRLEICCSCFVFIFYFLR